MFYFCVFIFFGYFFFGIFKGFFILVVIYVSRVSYSEVIGLEEECGYFIGRFFKEGMGLCC